jgi:hypothetical protein
MSTVIVELPADRLRQLQEFADRFGVTPEELARISIEDLLRRQAGTFEQASRSDLVLGAFADDPALIDQVVDDAMRTREVRVLRQSDE